MFTLSLKNIWAYKTRLGLSMLSVVLGITFMCGTLVFSDTLKGGFNDLFANIFSSVDVVVRPANSTARDVSGAENNNISVPKDLIPYVQKTDGVKTAEGIIQIPGLVVIGNDGKRTFAPNGPPTFGFAFMTNPLLTQFHVVGDNGQSLSIDQSVKLAPSDNEVYVDLLTAQMQKYKIGDTIKIVLGDSVRQYSIKGFVRYGSADGFGGSRAFIFDTKQAQDIAGQGDSFTYISVKASPGVSQNELRARVAKTVVEWKKTNAIKSSFSVITGTQLTKEVQKSIGLVINAITYVLLGFAGISFLVALFIIVNSFAIVLSQRKHEYALLRAIGSKSSQILTSVLIEALLVGVIASAIGVVLGIFTSKGIIALMSKQGIKLPAGGLLIKPYVVNVGFIVGVSATVLSALIPALIASRVSPIEALRESATEKQRSWIWRIIFSIFFAVLTSITIFVAFRVDDTDKIKVMGIAVFFLLIFAVGIFPLLVRPATAVLGSRVVGILLILFGGRHAFGVTGDIARRNNYRNPRRTSRTALALFIGVFLVSIFTVFASSTTASFNKYFDKSFAGDLIIGDGTSVALTQSRCDAIESLSVIKQGSCINLNSFVVTKQGVAKNTAIGSTFVGSFNTNAIGTIYKGGYKGKIENIGAEGALTNKKYATDHNLRLGDKLSIKGSKGDKQYTLTGILDEAPIGSGEVNIDFSGLERIEERGPSIIAIVTLKEGVTTKQAISKIDKILVNTGIEVTDQKTFRDNQISQLNGVVTMVYALLALAIIIASIGILNTMSLSILERRRELGLMRAIGTTKNQVRGFVRFEAMIISVLGAVMGMIFGTLSIFLVLKTLKSQGLDNFAVEPIRLIVIVVIAAIIGVIAGAWPAWRATKVDILKAVTVE